MEAMIYFLIWETNTTPAQLLLFMVGFFALVLGVGLVYVIGSIISEGRQLEHR